MTSRTLRAPPVLRAPRAPRVTPASRKSCRKSASKPHKRAPVVMSSSGGIATCDSSSSASRRHELAVKPEAETTDTQRADSECSSLREQLLLALVRHQRQDGELVALRALAKSLKHEVDMIHSQQQQQPQQSAQSHEFFTRDLELEKLRAENTQLRTQLSEATSDLAAMRAVIQCELPQLRLAAVRARAELASVASQLRDEQAHCDRLEAQLARLGAQRRPRTAAARASMSRAHEAFLLPCRSDSDSDGKNKDNDGKDNDNDKEQTTPCRRRSSPSPSAASRSSNSGSSTSEGDNSSSSSTAHNRSSEVQPLASDSVHRDLARLDRELRALHSALQG